MKSPLIGERDVACLIGASVATVRRWRLQRTGPPFRKLGSLVRYCPEELAAWLASRPSGGERQEAA